MGKWALVGAKYGTMSPHLLGGKEEIAHILSNVEVAEELNMAGEP